MPKQTLKKSKIEKGKNIVLMSDGTGQTEEQPILTNIAKLAKTLESMGQRKDQCFFYDAGVGTEPDVFQRLLGMATGNGIAQNIKQLYAFLCENYEPGDRIHLWGFSRGAATARSLAGMIRNVGILKKECLNKDNISLAYKLYVSDQDCDDPAAVKFRNQFSYFDEVFIKALYCYDTVTALGNAYSDDDDSYWYGFHDFKLSRMIRNAFHAMSLDEQRKGFDPTPMTPHESIECFDQRCFSGVHSDIGGGYQHHGLSDITYLWMLGWAEQMEMIFPPKYIENIKKAPVLNKFIDDAESSDDDLKNSTDPKKITQSQKQQLDIKPNYNDKCHDSRFGFKLFGYPVTIGIGHHRPKLDPKENVIDPSVKQRMEAKQRKYIPFTEGLSTKKAVDSMVCEQEKPLISPSGRRH